MTATQTKERKAYQVRKMQSDLKSKVGRIMAKAPALPVNLNLVPTVPSASPQCTTLTPPSFSP